MQKRFFLTIISFSLLIYCLFYIVGKYNTYAWFTSEIKASGQITNATTKDLLAISTNDISYLNNCKISQEIVIENISNMEIPIQLEEQHKKLKPGESFKTTMNQLVSCETSDVSYHLVGLNHYIDEMISVPLDQQKLLATIENKESIEKKEDNTNDHSDETVESANGEENVQKDDENRLEQPTQSEDSEATKQEAEKTLDSMNE